MEGGSRGDIREPQYCVIGVPGIPLHVQQPTKLLKLFQAGLIYLNIWPDCKHTQGPVRPCAAFEARFQADLLSSRPYDFANGG